MQKCCETKSRHGKMYGYRIDRLKRQALMTTNRTAKPGFSANVSSFLYALHYCRLRQRGDLGEQP